MLLHNVDLNAQATIEIKSNRKGRKRPRKNINADTHINIGHLDSEKFQLEKLFPPNWPCV